MSDDSNYQRFAFAPREGHTLDENRRAFRDLLSHYPTGVAVITALGETNTLVGITINSFTSVSLYPPLILWGLSRQSPSAKIFQTDTRFAINFLAEDQDPLAQRFATSRADKFEGVAAHPGLGEVPILDDTIGCLEARVQSIHEAGDHFVIIGEVDRFHHRDAAPLLYHRRKYRRLKS